MLLHARSRAIRLHVEEARRNCGNEGQRIRDRRLYIGNHERHKRAGNVEEQRRAPRCDHQHRNMGDQPVAFAWNCSIWSLRSSVVCRRGRPNRRLLAPPPHLAPKTNGLVRRQPKQPIHDHGLDATLHKHRDKQAGRASGWAVPLLPVLERQSPTSSAPDYNATQAH